MIIDTHTHLWLGREKECREAILRAAEEYGYLRAGVSTLYSELPSEEEITACNKATADFIRNYPELIFGWCYLNPRHKNTLDVLKRGLEEQRMTGVKLWIATLCDDPAVDPIAEYCSEHHIPVLIHALDKTVGQMKYESKGIHVRNLAKRFPELKILMAHMGGNEYTGIKPIIDCPNVSVDLCGVVHRADSLEYAIERLGIDRILYGTDMVGGGAFWNNIGRVEALELSAEEKAQIYHKNAETFIFGGR
ncbi:MAG: amidohydrolase [Oscillospiraceae bacterium]|nr:amidohydrolase [Oscillospiraceae bacterium]